MKKLVFAFIALLLLLIGCGSEQRSEQSDSTEYPYRIKEITYKEHDYIIFQGCGSSSYYSGTEAGAVHNPECHKCLNEKQINNADSDAPRKAM